MSRDQFEYLLHASINFGNSIWLIFLLNSTAFSFLYSVFCGIQA